MIIFLQLLLDWSQFERHGRGLQEAYRIWVICSELKILVRALIMDIVNYFCWYPVCGVSLNHWFYYSSIIICVTLRLPYTASGQRGLLNYPFSNLKIKWQRAISPKSISLKFWINIGEWGFFSSSHFNSREIQLVKIFKIWIFSFQLSLPQLSLEALGALPLSTSSRRWVSNTPSHCLSNFNSQRDLRPGGNFGRSLTFNNMKGFGSPALSDVAPLSFLMGLLRVSPTICSSGFPTRKLSLSIVHSPHTFYKLDM